MHISAHSSARPPSCPKALKDMVAHFPVPAMIVDVDFKVLVSNPSARRLLADLDPILRQHLGTTAEDVLYGNLHDIHPEPRRLDRALEEGWGNLDITLGPTHLTLHLSKLPHDQDWTGYVVCWDDTSTTHAHAANLRELERRQDALERSMMVLECTPNGTILAA
ncbi:MAG: hypothetical protein AAFX99_27595, partial [Myxococcota bacterium]